jgi:hypothetical protein
VKLSGLVIDLLKFWLLLVVVEEELSCCSQIEGNELNVTTSSTLPSTTLVVFSFWNGVFWMSRFGIDLVLVSWLIFGLFERTLYTSVLGFEELAPLIIILAHLSSKGIVTVLHVRWLTYWECILVAHFG